MRYVFLLLVCFSSWAIAEEEILTVDRSVSGSFQSSFPNDQKIFADISAFQILNCVLMSNDKGERWAVITVNNTANGQRTLNQKHLLALFANGDRIVPAAFTAKFDSNEILSITINFGEYKFPILEVYSRLEA
ncbi:hypothetical protein [Shewanella sp. UCD-KL21]|uniref:hypothetical protein n=1 Tax=Shewanella sp. UCD-KL21 TaxID=1917164 RepID=UPI0009714C09|nr:hypothetical protein [Shewanella sp. UCD-KL21]